VTTVNGTSDQKNHYSQVKCACVPLRYASKRCQSTTTVCQKGTRVPLQCVKRVPEYHYNVCQKGTRVPLQCVSKGYQSTHTVCQKCTCVPNSACQSVPEYYYSVCHTSILHENVNTSRSHHHAVQGHDVAMMKTGSYLHLQGGELLLPHLQPITYNT